MDFHQIKSFGGAFALPAPRLLHQGLAMQGKWTYTKTNVQCFGNSCMQCFPCKKTLHWVE